MEIFFVETPDGASSVYHKFTSRMVLMHELKRRAKAGLLTGEIIGVHYGMRFMYDEDNDSLCLADCHKKGGDMVVYPKEQ